MVEIVKSDKIKDFLVYDEAITINYKNKNDLYKEIICLSTNKHKFSKSSIIGFNKEIITFKTPIYNEWNKYNSLIKLDHSIHTPTIYLLNDKKNEYPIIDSIFLDFNADFLDLKKSFIFPKILPKISKTDIKCFKTLEMKINSLDILKDGRISITTDDWLFYIYNNDFSDKVEIKTGIHIYYHQVLKNGDILVKDNSNCNATILRLPFFGDFSKLYEFYLNKNLY